MELPTVSEIRPEVIRMARLMELQLQRNDRRGGWHNCTADYLLGRVAANVAELRGPDGHPEFAVKGEAFQRTCADVCNFVMMLSTNRHFEENSDAAQRFIEHTR